MPISIVAQYIGPRLFRFGNRLLPRGPPCEEIIEKKEDSVKRYTSDEGLPSLIVRCWRLKQFSKDEDAQKAVDAGMVDPHWSDAYFDKVPRDWLEEDSKIMEQISTACQAQMPDLVDE